MDLESSGLDPWRNSVLSLAWVITDDNYTIQSEFYQECSPDKGNRAWTVGAEKKHGFKEIDQRKKQPAINMCRGLLSYLGTNHNDQRNHFRYHANARFDPRMFFAWLNKNLDHEYFDIYKYLHPHSHISTIDLLEAKHPSLPSYALERLASGLGIKYQAHNALSDIKTTIQVCKHFGV